MSLSITFASSFSLHFRPRNTLHEKQVQRRRWETRSQLPAFMPVEAAEVHDVAAQRMMQGLENVPVSTPLREVPIGTVRHLAAADGNGTGASNEVVCLHGFDSNLLEYRHLAPLLQAGGVKVHSVDLLGWGFTEKPADVGYGVPQRREHLAAYLRSQCDGAVTLVGASLGGAVAMDLALEHPGLVSSLVLVDAQVYTDREASSLPRWAARLGAEVLRSAWLRYVAVRLSYQDVEYRTRDVLRIGGLHVLTDGWLNAAIDFILSEGYMLSTRVKEIVVPTLVLFGKYDKVIPRGDVLKFRDDLPDACHVTVDDAGHSPHIEKAPVVAEHILRFLGDAQPARYDDSRHVHSETTA